MFLATVSLFSILIILRGLPQLFRKKAWKVIFLDAALLGGGLTLSFLIQKQAGLPSLAGLLLDFIKSFLPFIPAFFQT